MSNTSGFFAADDRLLALGLLSQSCVQAQPSPASLFLFWVRSGEGTGAGPHTWKKNMQLTCVGRKRSRNDRRVDRRALGP